MVVALRGGLGCPANRDMGVWVALAGMTTRTTPRPRKPEVQPQPPRLPSQPRQLFRPHEAQYVQNLVSEQIAAIRDGVIGGMVEAVNEQLDRLFDETDKFLRRELDGSSAKLEAALADIRAAKAEMREEIRKELRTEMRSEIADRMALIKQPADGAPGPAGPPGKLDIVKNHIKGQVYYQRDLVIAGDGALYQAERDTAATPPDADRRCITRAGRDGKDALQLFASAGKRGQQGPKGERGERGLMGPLAIVPRIVSSGIDAGYNLNLVYTDGSTDTIPLRAAFEQFFSETST